MTGHGYWFVIKLSHESAALSTWDLAIHGALPSVGMTLFFVLSGFVIHLNYRASAGRDVAGFRDFMIARFSRLYPLFLIVFSIAAAAASVSLYRNPGRLAAAGGPRTLFEALLLHLTFTQTWWLWPIGPHAAYGAFWMSLLAVTNVTWSLSTEWFFYLCYPALARWFGRLHGPALAAAIGAIVVYALAYYLGALAYRHQVTVWTAIAFPDIPDGELFHWLAFLSPWGRISEFLLGIVAAQCYLTVRAIPPHVAEAAVWTAALALVMITFFVYVAGTPFNTVATSCYSGLFALLIFLVTNRSTSLSRLLSKPCMVRGGESSYSLYLLHFWVLGIAFPLVAKHGSLPARVILLVIGAAISLVLARVSYRFVERPATRVVRGALMRRLGRRVAVPLLP